MNEIQCVECGVQGKCEVHNPPCSHESLKPDTYGFGEIICQDCGQWFEG